jgi:hypothetical protein
MPWWGWVLGVLVALIALVAHSMAYYRRGLRRKFIALVKQEFPDIEILSESTYSLRFRSPTLGEGEENLLNLYRACARAGDAGEEAVLQQCIAALKDHRDAQKPLSMDAHGDKLFPRIVPVDFFPSRPDLSVPTRPLDRTGLLIAYVLDRPNSLEYLTDPHLKELGITADQLHERAMANLKKTMDEKPVQETLRNGSLSVLKLLDSHDAARLLLVPGYLPDGAELAAGIPDMDTLALLPFPKDATRASLKVLCTPGDGKPILDRPLKVTRSGISLVE